MIKNTTISLSCRQCGTSQLPEFIKCEGTLSWLQVKCSCGAQYEETVPVSHQTRFPIIRSDKQLSFGSRFSSSKQNQTHYYYYDALVDWLVAPWASGTAKETKFGYGTNDGCTSRKVRVFNCHDSCYGHALLRLLQCYPHLQQKEYGVVLLLPSALLWMVPSSFCGLIGVNGSLSQLKQPVANFDEELTKFLSKYEEVEFDSLPLDFDYSKIPIESFTRVKPFERTTNKPQQLTILWREDRFWLRSAMGERLAKIYYRYKWNWLKSLLLNRQKKNYEKVMVALKKKYPGLLVNVVGLASAVPKISWAKDERKDKTGAKIEKDWCEIYASSDLVIGIHGSHMLLPTALAGAFIELLPDWKITHQGEDILYNRTSLETKTLARTIPSRSRITEVVAHAESILGWWKALY